MGHLPSPSVGEGPPGGGGGGVHHLPVDLVEVTSNILTLRH